MPSTDSHPPSYPPSHAHSAAQLVEASVVFLSASGVLSATSGSAEHTRRYVWAPALEAMLRPHPHICLVYLADADELHDAAALPQRLGHLGDRIIQILPAAPAMAGAIQAWLAAHPEVREYRVLANQQDGYALSGLAVLYCDPERGLDDPALRASLAAWLGEAHEAWPPAGDGNHAGGYAARKRQRVLQAS